MQPQVSTEFSSIFVFLFAAFVIFVAAVFTIILLVAYCKISVKMGYHWALGLLMIVPFGNIILPLYLAFADWPIHRDLHQLRQQLGGAPA